jgi:hypothetical protein
MTLSHESEIRKEYRSLINDLDFDRIELELKSPNIFNVLGISRTEIRHSNFLAWLLNPNGSHGLGNIFLVKFLREISTSDITTDLDELEIENLNYSSVEIRREWNNIDLLIVFDSLVICVENKIDSQDHSNQLSRYRTIVNDSFKQFKKVFVYLTPFGESPNSIEDRDYYTPFSYESIVEQADKVLKIHGKSLSNSVFQYVSDYLTILKRELMKNDTLNELALKIYKNHKELFDFVYENKPDIATELYPFFVYKIEESGWLLGSKNKGYARFLTKDLDRMIPRKAQGWPLKECFLFEIDFLWNKNRAIFKTVIAPCDTEIQQLFCDVIENIPGSKKPNGKKWLVHFQHSWKFEANQMTNFDENDVKRIIDAEWEHISKIVKTVEAELLNHEAIIKQFC